MRNSFGSFSPTQVSEDERYFLLACRVIELWSIKQTNYSNTVFLICGEEIFKRNLFGSFRSSTFMLLKTCRQRRKTSFLEKLTLSLTLHIRKLEGCVNNALVSVSKNPYFSP